MEQNKFVWRLSSVAWAENKALTCNCGAELPVLVPHGSQR